MNAKEAKNIVDKFRNEFKLAESIKQEIFNQIALAANKGHNHICVGAFDYAASDKIKEELSELGYDVTRYGEGLNQHKIYAQW